MKKILLGFLAFFAMSCQEKEIDLCQHKGKVIIDKGCDYHIFSKKDCYFVFRKDSCAFEKVIVDDYLYLTYSEGDNFLETTLSERLNESRIEFDSVINEN